MHRLLLELPTRIETKRLYLRCYQAGDGPWYYLMSQKNKSHLARFETNNVVLSINKEEDAEISVRDFAVAWVARIAFLMGVFDQATHEFVAQIYIGVINWDLPEFELGYFADVDHQGQGYVTEAGEAALDFIFNRLEGQRVRLECDDLNTPSRRVAERLGMVQEGHIRENKRTNEGIVSGTCMFGMLRSEYMARKEQKTAQ